MQGLLRFLNARPQETFDPAGGTHQPGQLSIAITYRS